MKRHLLIHYSEIGLKGANKQYFVDKLKKQIKTKLEKRFRGTFALLHVLGRLMIKMPEKFDKEKYVEILGKIFAVKNFQFVYEGTTDLEKLSEQIWKNMPKEVPGETFRVRVKRSQKMDVNSMEMERKIGAILLKNGIGKKVRMKGADFVVNVEIFNDKAYFSYKKYEGAGGMSANSGGKLVSLISSGIDSPVAAYRMMRRGARIIFAHFHAFPYTDDKEIELVKKIVKILSEYQFDTKLYLVPYGKIQEEIASNKKIPSKVRTVMYRRVMLRIAEKIAKKERAKGIVTGDSYGQVASQTPENLFAVHDASSIPVFQPLIGYDKEEVIEIAREIGTLPLSEIQCEDPCTRYAPKNPEIKANVYDLREYEEMLDLEGLVEEALKNADVIS